MAPSSANEPVSETGEAMQYHVLILLVQTFFFGGYTALVTFTTRTLLKRGIKARPTRTLFIIGLFMYFLSLAYWAYAITDVVARMRFYVDPTSNIRFYIRVNNPADFFNALVYINFTLTDGIVIWRATVICRGDAMNRKLLFIPMFLLSVTTVSVLTVIALRIAELALPHLDKQSFFSPSVDILQVAGVGTSLLSNLSATGLVGITAWRHRRRIQATFRRRSKVEQVLKLLLESGLFYCAAAAITVVSLFVRLPHGTLGDIVLPVFVQFAGAYAPAMLLLISNNASLDDTEFLGTQPTLVSTRRNPPSVPPGASAARGVISAIRFAPGASATSYGEESGFSDNVVSDENGERRRRDAVGEEKMKSMQVELATV